MMYSLFVGRAILTVSKSSLSNESISDFVCKICANSELCHSMR